MRVLQRTEISITCSRNMPTPTALMRIAAPPIKSQIADTNVGSKWEDCCFAGSVKTAASNKTNIIGATILKHKTGAAPFVWHLRRDS